VVVNDQARGIIVRNLITVRWKATPPMRRACLGRVRNVYFLSTNGMNGNVSAIWRAHKKAPLLPTPLHADPSHLYPVHGTYQSKLTLMSESLRNDAGSGSRRSQGQTATQ